MLTIPNERRYNVRLWTLKLAHLQHLETVEAWLRGDPIPEPQLPLLRKVLDRIDNDPTCWRQDSWNACVVGWAMHEAGVDVPVNPGNPDAWLQAGAATLGLLPGEVRYLADELNDRIDIDTVARVIAQRAGETL